MRLYRDRTRLPDSARGAVAAIGNFDGVHLGHRAVIGAAVARAREAGRPSAVVTFEPHPRRFFKPDLPPFLLASARMKVAALRDCVQSDFVHSYRASFRLLEPTESPRTIF